MGVLPNQMNGIVKSVLSGDTVIIMGSDASRGPPPEKMLTLSGITAPRLANRNAGSADQPFAWGAREFLRQLAIGKRVLFTLEPNANPAAQAPGQGTPREYGQVVLAGPSQQNSAQQPRSARAQEREHARKPGQGTLREYGQVVLAGRSYR